MSLSTDALLFSIVLLLFAVWSSMDTFGSTWIVLFGLLVAVLALLGSLATAATGSESARESGEPADGEA
jgi:protein-S-isoprenylcysteine O-methyltransferase Ste14